MFKTKAERLNQLDLDYALMMGKSELLNLMRYHADKVKEHSEQKAEALRLLILLRENV